MQNPKPRRGLKFYGGLTLLFLGGLTLAAVIIAQGPDRDLHFVREVSSASSAATLDQAISAVINWPNWYYATADAKIIDAAGRPLPAKRQKLENGSIIKVFIDPKKGRWKQFEILIQVSEYIPGKKVRLLVLEDTKGKLRRLFDFLEWQIELLPGTEGKTTLIRGTVRAHTINWRSRFFGTVAQRILMHQVFYPDLRRLSEITQPLPVAPSVEGL